jgi:hypothetical protein
MLWSQGHTYHGDKRIIRDSDPGMGQNSFLLFKAHRPAMGPTLSPIPWAQGLFFWTKVAGT